MTEYEGVSCKTKTRTKNSAAGAKAVCIKDPTCWAVEGRAYCKGKTGGHVFTKKDGLVNLEEKDGAKVWIKGKNEIQRCCRGDNPETDLNSDQ